MDTIGLAVVAAVLLVVAGAWFSEYRRRARRHRDLLRLLERDRRLMVTVTPCGLAAGELATGYEACPRGDRNFGVRYGVEGPTSLEVDGAELTVDCAAFQWFWEVRRQTRTRGQRGTQHHEMTQTVAAIELPVDLWRRILIRPESMIGRTGMTRGGIQVESDAFNRSFRVEANDRNLAVQLLDASLQQLLVQSFRGRTIELRGRVLLVAGTPDHRDDSLTGIVGELPAVRQDVRRLLAAVPAQFWRAAHTG